MPRYFQDHRRHRRVAVHATAQVRLPSGQAWPFEVVNASSTGLCLRGDAAVVFDVEEVDTEGATQFLVDLTLPGGKVAPGFEAVQVWETREGRRVTSGWRFASLPADALDLLEAEMGVAPPGGAENTAESVFGSDDIDLWKLVEIFIRRRWTILGCVLVALIAAEVYVKTRPVEFMARAQILPVGEVDYLSQREAISPEASSRTPFITILASRPLVRDVATRTYRLTYPDSTVQQTLVEYVHELAESPPKPPLLSQQEWQRRLEDAALGWLYTNATFAQHPDKVIDITCKARHPELAAQVANAYTDEIRDYLLRSTQNYASQNIAMARARLDTLEREVREAERDVEAYRTANQQLLRDSVDISLAYPEAAAHDAQLQRIVQLKQSLYQTVASQYEMLRLQRSKNVAGVEVVSRAEPPLGPMPPPTKIVPLSAILGAIVGAFIALGAEYLATKRRSGQLRILSQAWQQDTAWLQSLRAR